MEPITKKSEATLVKPSKHYLIVFCLIYCAGLVVADIIHIFTNIYKRGTGASLALLGLPFVIATVFFSG